jgi:hypothetical protein
MSMGWFFELTRDTADGERGEADTEDDGTLV